MKHLQVLILIALTLTAYSASAATPIGADTFEILTNVTTGGDNTGDGGTGLPADYNYYYVGQSITPTIQITSGGTDASNIWIDYDLLISLISTINIGTYYPTWAGQTISAGRIKSTGFRISGTSSGTGLFGSFPITFTQPTEANYGTSNPTIFDINTGVIGGTTESNISLLGNDILDDEEDFYLHVWADTKAPYAKNPSPADTALGVSVDSNFTFDLYDSKNGEGDDSGVGTGVSTATPPGFITFDMGLGAISQTASASYICSGIWGSNLCATSVNPSSPSGIPGDARNFEYNATYTVSIGGYEDLASASQDQLGDVNGPNAMSTKTYTFTTEADTTAPQVTSQSPAGASTGNAVNTNIVVQIQDRKTYPNGISGVGVDPATCDFNVSSPSFTLTSFAQGHPDVTVTTIDYGYQFSINPNTDFAENETVTVTAYNCEDLVGNTMITDVWSFDTADSTAPFLTSISPANNASIATTDNLTFHIQDIGGGVDLSTVVVNVDGQYYSLGGGAVSLSTANALITSPTSLDLNGANYVGDTTGVTGTSADYTITINPQSAFTSGEIVVVIVYAADTEGNLMQQQVYAVISDGGACVAGSSYCGSNTTWNGSLCIGTGGGSGGSSGGGSVPPAITHTDVVQVDEDTVIVSVFSNYPSQAYTAYGLNIPAEYGSQPLFGFDLMSEVDENLSLQHRVVVNGLTTGTVYNFLPVIRAQGKVIYGDVMQFAPVFKTNYIEVQKVIKEIITLQGPERIVIRTIDSGATNVEGDEKIYQDIDLIIQPEELLVIHEGETQIHLRGKSVPNDTLQLIIY